PAAAHLLAVPWPGLGRPVLVVPACLLPDRRDRRCRAGDGVANADPAVRGHRRPPGRPADGLYRLHRRDLPRPVEPSLGGPCWRRLGPPRGPIWPPASPA